jgi:hypothetical protein
MGTIKGLFLIYLALFTPEKIPNKKQMRKRFLFIGTFLFALISLFSVPVFLELRQLKTASWDLQEQELTVGEQLPDLNGPLRDALLSGSLQLDDMLYYKKDGRLTRILIPFTPNTWARGELINIYIRYDINIFNSTAPAFNMLKDMGLNGQMSDTLPFTGVFEFISKIAESEKDILYSQNHYISDYGIYVRYINNANDTRYEKATALKTEYIKVSLPIALSCFSFLLFARWRLRTPNDKTHSL